MLIVNCFVESAFTDGDCTRIVASVHFSPFATVCIAEIN